MAKPKSRALRSAFLLLLAAAVCWMLLLGPIREMRVRQELSKTYQGFEIVSLNSHKDGLADMSFDAGGMLVYFFVLESTDVPGFSVQGAYYLSRMGGPPYDWSPRESPFDGKRFTRSESVALQRLWLKLYPGDPVQVGDDSVTGPVTLDRLGNSYVSTKYEKLPMNQVYRLQGNHFERFRGWDRGDFFRLDKKSGQWIRLWDYVEIPESVTRQEWYSEELNRP